jgi:hypothetical protein
MWLKPWVDEQCEKSGKGWKAAKGCSCTEYVREDRCRDAKRADSLFHAVPWFACILQCNVARSAEPRGAKAPVGSASCDLSSKLCVMPCAYTAEVPLQVRVQVE